MKNYPIRPETSKDFPYIRDLIQNAFANADYSDHQEQFLVERLRQDSAFLCNLALVAENEQGEIIGHIVFSEVVINGKKILALAPLSIQPEYQCKGVGTALINHAHTIIKSLEYPAIVVLGHPNYYTKFGYQNAKAFSITTAFDVPDGTLQILALRDFASLPKGEVEYARAFYCQS